VLIYFGTVSSLRNHRGSSTDPLQMSFALLYYAISARKWFKGPRVNVEHLIYSEPIESAKSGSGNAQGMVEKS
jgi:hypothetical protein